MKLFVIQTLTLTFGLAAWLGSAGSANAQAASRPLYQAPAPDSSKVYTYVAQMPVYPGGKAALTANLRREFQAAITAAGCTPPAFPVFVRLLVGPSGFVYAARSLNAEEADRRRKALSAANLPELPAACEAAIGTAAHRLPRLLPGRQNGRAVAVELMVKLLEDGK